MKCEDVMLSYVYKCGPEDSAASCAQLMKAENVGFVPVVDGAGKVLGVVTDRDLAVRLVAEERSGQTPVREIMTSHHLLTCRRDEDLKDVMKRMGSQMRARAMVIDGRGVCIGVVSITDIAGVEAPAAVGELLKDVTRRETIQVRNS
jgi:CBS domain-containing protein